MLRAALVTPLSGPLADYGRAGAVALELWAAESGARLTVHDAHPDPSAAVRAAEREQPELLFGPYGSGPARAVAAATRRLVFNHGGARASAANLIDVLAPAQTYFEGAIEVVRAADADARALRIVHGDTGFARAVAAGARAAGERWGFAVSATACAGAADRRGGPAEPARAADAPGPAHAAMHGRPADAAGAARHGELPDGDVLLVAGSFADERAAASRLRPGPWRAAGFVGAGVEEVLAGLRREGLLGPAQWLLEAAPEPDEGPSARWFADRYRERTGTAPPYPAAQAFAAGVIAARCVRDAGERSDGALHAAARALDCTTLLGRFRLDPRTGTQVGQRVLTVQWQDGARRVVWPPERAAARLRHPL